MTEGGRRAIALLLIVGLVGSVVIGGLATVFASSSPDGLERVTGDLGIEGQDSATADSPFAEYETEGIDNERSSAAVALVVGVGATALLGFGLFRVLSSGQRKEDGPALPSDRPDDVDHGLG